MIKYKRKLNVIAADPPEPIRLGQYDDDVVLEFELYSSEGILTIDPDTEVAIRGIKPDGNGISVAGTMKCTQDKRTRQTVYTALIDVTKQMTACAGECRYKLVLTKDGKELNTGSFLVIVDRTTLDKDAVPSISEIREIVETLDRTDDLLKASRSITKAKKEIEETVNAVRDMKDAVQTAADLVESDKTAAEAMLIDVRKLNDTVGEMIKEMHAKRDAVLDEIESEREKAVSDIESAKNTASESLDIIQRKASEQIYDEMSRLDKAKDTTSFTLKKMSETLTVLQKSIDDLTQAHKDTKARVEHMEFEMFKTGGEET